MASFRRIYSFDYMGHMRWWFVISAVIIGAGLVSMVVKGGGNPLQGLNYGLEFKQGTRIVVTFEKPTDTGAVRGVVTGEGYRDAVIQQLSSPQGGGSQFQIQTEPLTSEEQEQLRAALDKSFSIATDPGTGSAQFSLVTVGPTFGREVITASYQAVILALILILGYVSLRFEWRFAVGAIAAEIHDLLVVVGVYSITGREVTTATIAAVLTILGYSLYDTVIVYDRIRENAPKMRGTPYKGIVNRSIWETLTRSINTTMMVLLPVLCLFLFGGATLKDFAFALLVGIFSGAYSSIFVASPVVTLLKQREPQYRKLAARAEAKA